MSKKAEATKLTDEREGILARFLTGEDVPLTCFSCSPTHLTQLRDSLRAAYPFKECKKVGGMGKHYDGIVDCADGSTLRYELKYSDKKISESLLSWRPWEGGVQFVQSQFKSEMAKTFLDADLLYTAWFNEQVQPFLTRHLRIGEMTYEDYYRSSSSLDAHKKGTTTAAKFLRALRASKPLQLELQKRWLRFEEEWMPTHLLNHEAFGKFVKEVIEQKDIWININKECAIQTEGFLVKGVKYDGVSRKPHGGMVYNYTMLLQKKSGGEIRESKIQFKFTWKNGGQAVQNLNFLIVSA
jgi:hypothetical protein